MTEQMEKAAESLQNMHQEMSHFANGWVDANMKSCTAAAKGWDESSQSAGHMMQENISRLMSAGRSMSEIKSMRDAMNMQQEIMKDCMDMWMAGCTKLSEISARTMKDVVEPVAQHTSDAMSRMMQKTRAVA